METRCLLKISRISGILSPIIAYAFIFIAISHAPWFSWTKNALSDLGAIEPSQIYFNSGLIMAGILMLIFSIGIIFRFRKFSSKIGAFILILDSISLIGVGVFPEYCGRIHMHFSIAFFLLHPVAGLIIGGTMIKTQRNIKLGTLMVAMALASLLTWMVPWRNFNVTGIAIPEVISSLIGSAWTISMAKTLGTIQI